jgi:hydrogenase maturation protease
VILVDSMRSGLTTGTIRRFDASSEPLPARLRTSSSTHAFALSEAIELGRALGRTPARVIVYAIEGRSFEAGSGLSDELETALPKFGEMVLREARRHAHPELADAGGNDQGFSAGRSATTPDNSGRHR